jgi:hypothetical protein
MSYNSGNPSDPQSGGNYTALNNNDFPENIPDTPTERPTIKKIDIEPLAVKDVQVDFKKEIERDLEESDALINPDNAIATQKDESEEESYD